MLCANIINGEISLVKEEINLASYNEVIDGICCGEIEVNEFTLTKDGIVIWDEEKSDIEFIRFRC